MPLGSTINPPRLGETWDRTISRGTNRRQLAMRRLRCCGCCLDHCYCCCMWQSPSRFGTRRRNGWLHTFAPAVLDRLDPKSGLWMPHGHPRRLVRRATVVARQCRWNLSWSIIAVCFSLDGGSTGEVEAMMVMMWMIMMMKLLTVVLPSAVHKRQSARFVLERMGQDNRNDPRRNSTPACVWLLLMMLLLLMLWWVLMMTVYLMLYLMLLLLTVILATTSPTRARRLVEIHRNAEHVGYTGHCFPAIVPRVVPAVAP